MHDSCVDLAERKAAATAAEDDVRERDAPVEWGHESTKVTGFTRSLDSLLSERRAELCFRGVDKPAAGGLNDEALWALWGVKSKAAAEAQLLSWAAAAAVDPPEMRARALSTTDTSERMQVSRIEEN